MTGQEPPSRRAPSPFGRRGFLLGGAALAALGGAAAIRWYNVTAELGAGDLTVEEAHRAAVAGEVILIDIRRPDEWAQTGVPQGAHALDMRGPDFLAELSAATGGDRDRPVALICARGVRSAALGARLAEAGYTRVLNVPEGMLGSGAGPGWIASGLPVTRPD